MATKTKKQQSFDLIKLYVSAEMSLHKTNNNRFWSEKMDMYNREHVKLTEKTIEEIPFYKVHLEKMCNAFDIKF